MSQPTFGPPVVAGLGTALPEHVMSQDEAVELAQQICCRTDEERALVRVLYRRSGVKRRYTAAPHKLAFEYLAQPVSIAAADAPTAGSLGAPLVADDLIADTLTAGTLNAGTLTADAFVAAPAALFEVPGGTVVRGATTGQRMDFYRAAAPPLALQAAEKALADAGIDPATITHLVTVSCTGFFAPGIDAALIEGLALPCTVERLQVGFMGCHGGINGLRAADAIVRARPESRVLMVAVELCSLHFCFEWDPARAVGNAVFGDGAAALVLQAGPAIDNIGQAAGNGSQAAGNAAQSFHNIARSDGAPSDGARAPSKDSARRDIEPSARWRLAATGSCLLPDSADAMTWRIGDHGFEMHLSTTVPNVIGERLRPWLTEWLAGHGISLESVGSWAVHPGGPRILSAVEEALALPRSATAYSRDVLAECGNMSSPTVFFIVERMQAAGCPRPCVALGFGPGLTAEAALFV